jgi:hypothetical protein
VKTIGSVAGAFREMPSADERPVCAKAAEDATNKVIRSFVFTMKTLRSQRSSWSESFLWLTQT